MTPADLERICLELIVAQRELAALPTAEIIAAIDRTAHRLQQPHAERTLVLESLQQISGFSARMAAFLLDRVCEDWKAPALETLVRAEFGTADPLAGFSDGPAGRRVRAVAPPLGLHIFAGNVPGVSVTSIVRALLVRSAVLGKPAAAEPALARVFVDILRAEHEALGRAVEIIYWKGGERTLEDVALRHASLVVHYGGADAIRDLRARAPAHITFVEHGPRISFALIHGRCTTSRRELHAGAAHTARAVALFDQQGCVSPQVAWVIGTHEQARAFAAAVADELARVQQELPRGRITLGEAAAIRELRTRAEFSSDDASSVWGPSGLEFTVILARDTAMEGTCLNRTLMVKAAPHLDDVIAAVLPFRDLLQTAGLSGFDAGEATEVADALAAVGVTRITPVGDMPWPPPWWHHDGRGPLQELVRWVDLEG